MNLHEQYAELVRRGMPEHPRLYPQTRDYTTVVIDKATGKAVNGPVQSEPVCWALACDPDEHHPNDPFIDPDDARDLLTCHAARHFNLTPIPTSKGKWYCFEGTIDHGDYGDEYWFGGHDFHEKYADELGDDPLAAILAATEHLGVEG